MSKHCELTDSLQQSKAKGEARPDHEAHAASCDECAAVLRLSPFFAKLAAEPLNMTLPDTHLLWLKAQLVRSRKKVEKEQKAFDLLQLLPWAGVTICWAVLITRNWPEVLAWYRDFSLSRVIYFSVSGGFPVALMAVVVILTAITGGLALRTAFQEE